MFRKIPEMVLILTAWSSPNKGHHRTLIRPDGHDPCAGHSVVVKRQPEMDVDQ